MYIAPANIDPIAGRWCRYKSVNVGFAYNLWHYAAHKLRPTCVCASHIARSHGWIYRASGRLENSRCYITLRTHSWRG